MASASARVRAASWMLTTVKPPRYWGWLEGMLTSARGAGVGARSHLLDKPHELVLGARGGDAIAEEDDRAVCPGQDRGRTLDRHGVRAGAPSAVAGRGYGRIDLLVQQVLGQGDEDGTGWGLGGYLEGAREHEKDVLRAAQLGAPLGVLAGGLHEVAPQQRLLGDEAGVLLARRDD